MIEGQQRRINHDYLKSHFFREGRLKEQQALYIIEQATNVLSREANMVHVTSPVTSESFGMPLQLTELNKVQQYAETFMDNTLDSSPLNRHIEC